MATAIDEFTPTSGLSGYINAAYGLMGYSYTVYSGVDAQVGKNYTTNPTNPTLQRSFFSFDTSSIPNDATITKVRFYLHVNSTLQSNGPDDWLNRWYMGSFIGASLDSSDWGGGTSVKMVDWPTTPTSGWVEFRAAAGSYVSKTGNTDVCIRDTSSESFPWGSWQIIVPNNSRTKLEVTYDYTPVEDAQMVFYNLGG